MFAAETGEDGPKEYESDTVDDAAHDSEDCTSNASHGDDEPAIDIGGASEHGSKRRRADRSHTYGVRTLLLPDGSGEIAHSFGRAVISGHCPNPLHNLPGMSRCRLTRRATRRALGSIGCFMLECWDFSSKEEHMARAASKPWTMDQRMCGRAYASAHIPAAVLSDATFERPAGPGEGPEPTECP